MATTNTLIPGGRLNPGDPPSDADKLVSASGRFELWYRLDGNCVIYDTDELGWKAIWQSTNPHGSAPGYVTLLPNGQLTIYDKAGLIYWNSDSGDFPPVSAILQDDGRLIIHCITPQYDTSKAWGALPPPSAAAPSSMPPNVKPSSVNWVSTLSTIGQDITTIETVFEVVGGIVGAL
jgi:hypothetical protein